MSYFTLKAKPGFDIKSCRFYWITSKKHYHWTSSKSMYSLDFFSGGYHMIGPKGKLP